MKKLFLLALTVLISHAAVTAQTNEALTTFILVRHAEKASQNAMTKDSDPKLSEEGLKRADHLAELFSMTSISAVYSTPYERTRSTVAPLAKAKSLEVQSYEPGKNEAIDKIWNENLGKTVVICGHSNTIPKIANYLSGTNDFKDFSDSDYGNIIIVTILQKGKASVTWMRY
jgi:broad specificity phosphatase PhoE